MSKPPPPSLPKLNPRLPNPPTREVRSRMAKSDVTLRGFGSRRGTSKSPHLMYLKPDACDDEDAIASDAGEDGLTQNNALDDVSMVADGGGKDSINNTTADTNGSVHNQQGGECQLGSQLGEGDSYVQADNDARPIRNDDVAQDFAILGDSIE